MPRHHLLLGLVSLALVAASPAWAQPGRGNERQNEHRNERQDERQTDRRNDRQNGSSRAQGRGPDRAAPPVVRREPPRGNGRGPFYPPRMVAGPRDDGRGAGPNHDWHRGGRLPYEYRNHSYVVDDWRGHRLSQPPRGYHWVQAGGDYLLVAIATGVILQLLLSN